MKSQSSNSISLLISSLSFSIILYILLNYGEIFRSTHFKTLLAGFLCSIESVLSLNIISDLKVLIGSDINGWFESI